VIALSCIAREGQASGGRLWIRINTLYSDILKTRFSAEIQAMPKNNVFF